MNSFFNRALIAGAGLALFSSSAMAAWTFSSADLVIAFHATGGQGATTNLFFNLGDSYQIANGDPAYGVVGNINADLAAAYGAGWASRTDVWFGVVSNRSNLSAAFEPGTPGVSDPGRVFYVSAPTISIGGSNDRQSYTSNQLGNAGSTYAGLKNNLGGLAETAFGAGVASLSQATHPVQWNNNWGALNPTPGGAAFGLFEGGIQQQLGAVGFDNIVDIQRVSPNLGGSYVGSVIVSDNGNIALVPEPSTSLLAAMAGGFALLRRRRKA